MNTNDNTAIDIKISGFRGVSVGGIKSKGFQSVCCEFPLSHPLKGVF